MQLFLLLLIELYTLFQLWLISVPKTINWKCIMSYLAVGTLGVTAITLTFHLVSARIIPPAINSYTINPFIEEMITILPVILLARFTVLKEKLSILDWMLLGAALGCGFQIMETGIRIIGLSQKWPHFQVGWTDVGDILTTWLPERIEDRNIGYAGHGIAAAFMGLGVGFWARYKRWGWIIFLATFLWCVLDHSLSNYTLGSWAGQKKLAKFFWGITLKGKSMPWVLGLAVVGISLHDIYQRSAFRSVAEKCGATIAEITNRIGKSVFWHHPISTLRKSFHDHIAEFRGKSGLGKTYEIVRIYFWFSIIVVFFLNGIFPKSFYRWYLKTPFWWSAGIIGHAFALWFAWKWFNKWHTGPVPRNIRSQIIFWGQGFISVVSPLLAAGSVAVVIMAIIGKPILLKTSYLYYAANAFLDFIRNGLSPALGVLNGIGGFVSNAYAHDATPRNVAQNVADGGTTSGTEAPVWPANGRVTSEFHEVSSVRNNRLHNGIDIANPVGANVMASDSGIVHDITPGRTGANQVIVNNDDGSRSGYAHVSPSVNVGDRINRGDVVGTTDLSGRSTGGHVHYTYKPNAESDHIDPRQHLRQRE